MISNNTEKIYFVTCKTCGNIKSYSWKTSFEKGKKLNNCNKCKRTFKEKWKEELSNDDYEKRYKDYSNKISLLNSGKNNHMYNKTIYDVWIEKYGKEKADILKETHRKNSIDNNKKGMTGKTFYGQWLEKYGKEIADQKLKDYSEKQKLLNSGENNSMYGKPAPQGSGCGWKGHYKGWFFRSLRELSYMINVIEKNNYVWKTAESKDLTINYVSYDGTPRTYRADFLINDKILVEIKPLRLHNTPLVLLKKEAAEKFCQQHNLTYDLTDIEIDTKIIIEKYKNGIIIFNGIYNEKINNYIKRIENA